MMIPAKLRLLADQKGAAVIELALAAPMFAMLTIGIIDISNAFSRKLALEQGAHRAIEKVMQTTGSTTVADTIKTEAVCQVDGVKADGTCNTSPITAANVTVTYRLECSDAGGTISPQTSNDADQFDALTCAPGTVKEAKYLEVAVTDKFVPMFSTHFAGFNSADGTYHISATAGMRTK
jgi:Flp pilus assembly protein TadG